MKAWQKIVGITLFAIIFFLGVFVHHFDLKITQEKNQLIVRSKDSYPLWSLFSFDDPSRDELKRFNASTSAFLNDIKSWIKDPSANKFFFDLQTSGFKTNDKIFDNSSFSLKKIEYFVLANRVLPPTVAPVFITLKKFPLDKNFEGPPVIDSIELADRPEWKICLHDNDCQIVSKFCPLQSAVNQASIKEYSRYAQAKQTAAQAGFEVYSLEEKNLSKTCGQKSFFEHHSFCNKGICEIETLGHATKSASGG